MREQVAPGHVAARVDSVDARAPAVVDDDRLGRALDPEIFDAQAFLVGPAPDRDEQLVRRPRRRLALLGAVDDLLAVLDGDLLGLDVETQVDALGAQLVDEPVDEGGLVLGQDARALLEQGHRDAEPGEALHHLDRDRAAADVHEARRRVLELEEALAGDEACLREALDGRDGRAAAGAQQHVAGLEGPVADLHRVLARELGGPVLDVDAHLLEALGVVVGRRDLLLHGADVLPHAAPVDRRLDRLDAELVGRAHVMCDLARREERLARDAARPETVAADPGALGDGDLEVERGGELGRHHVARAHPDDDEVVPVCHSSPPRRACGAYGAAATG